jgi:hypothetical protein
VSFFAHGLALLAFCVMSVLFCVMPLTVGQDRAGRAVSMHGAYTFQTSVQPISITKASRA